MTNYYMHNIRDYEANGQRGGLIYISKNERVLNLFPTLSRFTFNDTESIKLIPLYMPTTFSVERPLVYNNGLHTQQNTRDEYRIYTNNELTNNGQFLKPNDIVVFIESAKENHIYIDCITPQDKEYEDLNTYINSNKINNGFHAIYEGELEFIDKKIKN